MAFHTKRKINPSLLLILACFFMLCLLKVTLDNVVYNQQARASCFQQNDGQADAEADAIENSTMREDDGERKYPTMERILEKREENARMKRRKQGDANLTLENVSQIFRPVVEKTRRMERNKRTPVVATGSVRAAKIQNNIRTTSVANSKKGKHENNNNNSIIVNNNNKNNIIEAPEGNPLTFTCTLPKTAKKDVGMVLHWKSANTKSKGFHIVMDGRFTVETPTWARTNLVISKMGRTTRYTIKSISREMEGKFKPFPCQSSKTFNLRVTKASSAVPKMESIKETDHVFRRNVFVNNASHISSYDCSQGTVGHTKIFKTCMKDYRKQKGICDNVDKAGLTVLYNDLLSYGAAFDFNGALDGYPRVIVSVKGEHYDLSCPIRTAKVIPSSRCFSEGAIPIKLDGVTKYRFRNGLVSTKSHEIPCKSETIEETVRAAADFRLQTLISEEIMSSFIFFEIEQPMVLSKIFNLKNIARIVLLEESFISGASPESYVTFFYVLYRKISPYAVGFYMAFRIIFSLAMFILAKAMRLKTTHAFAFCLPFIKSILDFRKWLKEKKLSDETLIFKQYRQAQNRKKDAGLAEVTVEHFSSIYDVLKRQNERLAELERQIREYHGASSGDSSFTDVSTEDAIENQQVNIIDDTTVSFSKANQST